MGGVKSGEESKKWWAEGGVIFNYYFNFYLCSLLMGIVSGYGLQK